VVDLMSLYNEPSKALTRTVLVRVASVTSVVYVTVAPTSLPFCADGPVSPNTPSRSRSHKTVGALPPGSEARAVSVAKAPVVV